MSQEIYEGGCLCGAVRYRASGTPFDVVHCHCGLCRKASGAPFVSWASFETKHVSYPHEQPASFVSSPQARRFFCAKCGTQLGFQYKEKPEVLDLTIASMDEPARFDPKSHIWTSNRLPWIRTDDGLPCYPRSHH